MTAVSIRALSKTYPGQIKPALDQLSLNIDSGELIALVGPSGCGKTSALMMIAGLLMPTSGDITFDGRSILPEKPEQRGAVMVFQNPLLFPSMSVAGNIGFGLKMRKCPRADIDARVDEMLALVQLPGLGQRRPSDLSGGQQQRVALARALILRPRVLLLDEPLSNLDAHLRLEMRDLIRGLQKQMRVTTIFVTHDQAEAAMIADRMALVLDGRLHQYGQPDEFYRRPIDLAVARFFGGQNFVPGTSDGAVFQSALGPLHLPDAAHRGPGTLTFRPESIKIGPAAENALIGRLTERLSLGTQIRARFAVADVVIEAALSPDQLDGVPLGAAVPISLPRAALWVLA